MKFVTTHILIIALLIATCCIVALNSFYFSSHSKAQEKKISGKDLQEDFHIFRHALEEAHSGLYLYTTKKEMDDVFNNVNQELNSNMNEVQFYKLLLPVVAKIRCVHTHLTPSKEMVRNTFTQMKLMPVSLYFSEKKAFLKEYWIGDESVDKGFEVAFINQTPMIDIIKKMFSIISTDGFNESQKYYLMNKLFFNEAYALLFQQPDTSTIELLNPLTKKRKTVQLPSITFAELNKARSRVIDTNKNDMSITINDSVKSAVLVINTFAPKGGIKAFRDSITSYFKKIQKAAIKSLVIDLRNNGGGINSNVTDLYSYVATKPFVHIRSAEMKVQALSFEKYVENIESFRKPAGSRSNGGTYDVSSRYPGSSLRRPAEDYPFRGNVFIISGGGTVSAASEFVALAFSNKRATIIGEETGGCYYGSSGGEFLNLELPNTKIKLRIPTILIRLAVDSSLNIPLGRGVLPHYEYKEDLNSILYKRDGQLEFTVNLAKQRSDHYNSGK